MRGLKIGVAGLVLTVLLVALLSTSSTFAQGEKMSATIEQFREYGNVLVGRWTAEITLTDDLPGFGKKGDKLTGYATHRWIADGKALEGEWVPGRVTGKWICMWDGESKQIKTIGVDSTGAFGDTVIAKVNGKWVEKSSGAFPDGKKVSSLVVRTVEDKGDTHIL